MHCEAEGYVDNEVSGTLNSPWIPADETKCVQFLYYRQGRESAITEVGVYGWTEEDNIDCTVDSYEKHSKTGPTVSKSTTSIKM